MSYAYVEEKGRRLMIEFTCGRCGVKQNMPYRLLSDVFVSRINIRGNMRAARVPPGWREANGFMPMLCSNCATALDNFMDAPRDTAGDGPKFTKGQIVQTIHKSALVRIIDVSYIHDGYVYITSSNLSAETLADHEPGQLCYYREHELQCVE